MREYEITRKTKETDINLKLCLDGSGKNEIDSGCGFLNHMLELFSNHSRFDLKLKCKGDTNVDYHHTVEDIGIVLGEALKKALGDKKGITRYGDIILPMDEALVLCALDLSGRSYLSYDVKIRAKKVGDFDIELIEEFMLALTRSAEMNLHIKMLSGRNTHHILEAVFKSLARALKKAVAVDLKANGEIPSSKGAL